jgi:hypothetical protein
MADQQRGGGRGEGGRSGGADRSEADRLRESRGTIGRGMTSPDSTEVPLSAETGEPDERTYSKGRGGQERYRSDAGEQDSRSAGDRDRDRDRDRNR